MSKTDKLLRRFLSRPTDFTYGEIIKLFKEFGYEEVKTGKTAGSRVGFYNKTIEDMIKFHRPHPTQIMKRCYLNDIEKHLKDKGVIK